MTSDLFFGGGVQSGGTPTSVSVPPGGIIWFTGNSPPTGFVKANGAGLNVSAYSDLDLATWVGETENSSAPFFYHFTDINDPENSRDSNGQYLKLIDLRGEFIRNWDDGRGVDVLRTFRSWQTFSVESHSHEYGINSGPTNDFLGGSTAAFGLGSSGSTGVFTKTYGNGETRPRNIALLACIAY